MHNTAHSPLADSLTPASAEEAQQLRVFTFGLPPKLTGAPSTKRLPSLGSRYTKHHVLRRDTLTGFYEELNSPLTSRSEMYVQHALLTQPAPPQSLLSKLRALARHMTHEKS